MIKVLMTGLALATAVIASSALAQTSPSTAPQTTSPMDEAYQAAQWADLSVTAQALARGAARKSAQTPELRDLIDQLIAARQQYDVLETAANTARGASGDTAAYKARTLTAAADQADATVQSLAQKLSHDYPAYNSLVAPFPISIADTQALLAADEALVLIHPTPDGTYIFCLRNTSAQWYRTTATGDDLAAEVDSLRFALDPGRDALRGKGGDTGSGAGLGTGLPQDFVFSRQTAYHLYQQVLEPAAPALAGAKVVYVSTSGALSYLPLSVLVTKPPVGDDRKERDVRRTDWLVRSYALATLPSVNSLKFLRQGHTGPASSAAAAGADFIGFGSPDLTAAERADDLAPLPGAQSELLAMAKLFSDNKDKSAAPKLYLGDKATEKTLRDSDLSQVRILAFATHALRAGDIDGLDEPALVLTDDATPGGNGSRDSDNDGLLTASEAASLHLNADWVILSACNTAAGRKKAGAQGDEVLSGLARGFLASGARSLIVSHWRIQDSEAARLTAAAVRYYVVDHQGRAEALRTAMLDMLDDRHDADGALPSNWGAMVVVGEAK